MIHARSFDIKKQEIAEGSPGYTTVEFR